MTASRGHLRAVPDPPGWRCQLATQAIMCGAQDWRVRAVAPEAGPHGYGSICLRVGRVIIYLEDRESLISWRDALAQAEQYTDRAFGPELPPPAYRPRGSTSP